MAYLKGVSQLIGVYNVAATKTIISSHLKKNLFSIDQFQQIYINFKQITTYLWLKMVKFQGKLYLNFPASWVNNQIESNLKQKVKSADIITN